MNENKSPESSTPASLPGGTGLVTKRQVAAYLNLTTRSVENLHKQGLPYFRLGARRNRYDLAAVKTWLDRSCRIVRSE